MMIRSSPGPSLSWGSRTSRASCASPMSARRSKWYCHPAPRASSPVVHSNLWTLIETAGVDGLVSCHVAGGPQGAGAVPPGGHGARDGGVARPLLGDALHGGPPDPAPRGRVAGL